MQGAVLLLTMHDTLKADSDKGEKGSWGIPSNRQELSKGICGGTYMLYAKIINAKEIAPY